MPASPYWFHPPGNLTRSAVLDIGLKCPHSCRFCYYSFLDGKNQFKGLRAAGLRPIDKCLDILGHFTANAYLNYDVTGGEPTVHPDLAQVIATGSKLGLTSRVITLGQFLRCSRSKGQRLLDQLIEAGLTDFLFSLHAVDEARFADYTGGSWNELRAVLDELDGRGFQYSANTVVFAGNLDALPDIARESARRGVYHHNFIMFNAFHQWDKMGVAPPPQARFDQASGPLCDALDILDEAGVASTVRYTHLCALPSRVRHVVGLAGLHHDPHEWINRAMNHDRDPAFCAEPVHSDPGRERETASIRLCEQLLGDKKVIAVRGDNAKAFPARCQECAAMRACDGVDPKYLAANGDEELAPFTCFDVRANLSRERLGYLPPFFLKASPHADMRGLFERISTPWKPDSNAVITVVVESSAHARALSENGASDIEIMKLPEGRDLASRRNAAVEAAGGEAICFLEPGMTLAPSFAAEGLAALGMPGVGFVQADIQMPGGALFKQGNYGFPALTQGPLWSGPMLVRRRAVIEAGGYSPKADGLVDWDILLAGAEQGWFGAHLPRALIRAESSPCPPKADAATRKAVLLERQRLFSREAVLEAWETSNGNEPL
jgi:pyrroloquinoline quinone biosynthesis protein E